MPERAEAQIMTTQYAQFPFACVVVFILAAGCSGSTERPAESAPNEEKEQSIESLFEDPPPEVSDEPTMSERLLPQCATDKSATKFPRSSEGAAFRAIINMVIDSNGRAKDLCYRRVEGPLDVEEKAMSDRNDWKFDKKFAGQKREKLIVYRKNNQ
jgi:hypothetical protein